MKQRKIAISLAVVGAIAAPFAFRTYKARPITHALVPLTANERTTIAARLKETNNCQTIVDGVKQQLRDAGELNPSRLTDKLLKSDDFLLCFDQEMQLRDGGHFEDYPGDLKYLAINAATAVSAFVVVFGLTYLLAAIGRRYWRWLNT
jgi:hypothetical protein